MLETHKQRLPQKSREAKFLQDIVNYFNEKEYGLKYITVFINQKMASSLNKDDWQMVMQCTDSVRAKIYNFLDKLYNLTFGTIARRDAVIFMKNILEVYSQFYKTLMLLESAEESIKAHLHTDRAVIINDGQQFQLLNSTLSSIKRYFKKANVIAPICFISYAWPIQLQKKQFHNAKKQSSELVDESWVQGFLKGLRKDLRQAGIAAYLDIVDNDYGSNIYQFMEKARSSSYVLLMGTESLLHKHNERLSLVCAELKNIQKKRWQDTNIGLAPRVYPISLNGSSSINFPTEYESYSTIRFWQRKNYFDNLKDLMGCLYEVGPEHKEYNEKWNDLEKKLQGNGLAPAVGKLKIAGAAGSSSQNSSPPAAPPAIPDSTSNLISHQKHSDNNSAAKLLTISSSSAAFFESPRKLAGNGKNLPVGYTSFTKVLEDGFHFIDKSELIRAIMKDSAEVLLITHPRGFGKTLNLSMIKKFLAKPILKKNNKNYFAELKISKDVNFCQTHHLKYPLIHIKFNKVTGDYDSVRKKLYMQVRKLYRWNHYLLDGDFLTVSEKEDYKKIQNWAGELNAKIDGLMSGALKDLIKFLHSYHKERAVFVLDDFDVPFMAQCKDKERFIDTEVTKFIGDYLGDTLKEISGSLIKAVLFGVIPFQANTVFSGKLNKVTHAKFHSPLYKNHFCFTFKEVVSIIGNQEAGALIAYYGGYKLSVNEEELFNPYSIASYIRNKNGSASKSLFELYWGSSEVAPWIDKFIRNENKEDFFAKCKTLSNGDNCRLSINEDLNLKDLGDKNISSDKLEKFLWGLLYFSGCLVGYDNHGTKEFRSPNMETRDFFRRLYQDYSEKNEYLFNN